MNKIIIPTLLIAAVIVSGFFAFTPVEQASTVHSSVLDAAMVPFKIACDVVTLTGGAEDGEITLDVNGASPVLVSAIYFESGTGTGATTSAVNTLRIDDIRVDDVTLTTDFSDSVGSFTFDDIPTEGELLLIVDLDNTSTNIPLIATTDIGVDVDGDFIDDSTTYTLTFAGYRVSGDTAPTCDITDLD